MDAVCKQKTILIVDDEADLREILAFDFQTDGYSVLCAENGKTAFDRVIGSKVDLVITDTRMPVCNGITLLNNIKERLPQLPVIMFITESGDLSVEEAYNRGAEALFAKPFDRKALKNAVKNILAPRGEVWTRSGDRHSVSLNIELAMKAAMTSSYKLINIARGGMFVAQDKGQPPRVGEVVGFSLQVPTSEDKLVQGSGIVRWTREAQGTKVGGFGIEFVEFQGEARGLFLEFINSLTTKAFIPNG